MHYEHVLYHKLHLTETSVFPKVSVFMLTTITIERAVAIIFPLKVGRLRMSQARIIAGSGWIVCVILSLVPATGIDYFGNAFFGRTGKATLSNMLVLLYYFQLICKYNKIISKYPLKMYHFSDFKS